MNKVKKLLFVAQEIEPFTADAEMGQFTNELIPSCTTRARESRSFMPKWGGINERRNQLHEVIRLSGMNIIIDQTDHPLLIKVATINPSRVQVYFIDNEEYYGNSHKAIECNLEGEEVNNLERAVFYARGVLETVKKLGWIPDVVHCMGWISSIVPFYIRKAYATEPSFRDCKIVYTPTASKIGGKLPENATGIIPHRGATMQLASKVTGFNTMGDLDKLGIYYSDLVAPLTEDEPLVEYAIKQKKQVMPILEGKTWAESFIEFTDNVWSEAHPEKNEDDD